MPEYDAQRLAGLREGEVLADKYRIERVLGQGGNGVVVLAHHIALDEEVAIKFLKPEMLDDSVSVNRFLREARAAVKIKGEHVARVFDVGTLDNGAPYMVMEYLEGQDLAEVLKVAGTLPIEQVVDFVLQACVAVAEAHRLGIVHRDLKPANLFCLRRRDGQLTVKVLDFGISKMTSVRGGISGAETGPATFVGSPFYMSPEQMRAAPDLDPRTDIWALGVILYELLTGQVPFHGQNIAELATKVVSDLPVRVRTLRPEVPAALEATVLRCLSKDRAARPADVAALAAALQEFGPRHAAMYVDRIAGTLDSTSTSGGAWSGPSSSKRGGARPGAAVWTPSGTDPSMQHTVGRGLRRTTGALAAITLVVAAGLGTAIFLRSPARTVRASGDSGSISSAPPPVSSATTLPPDDATAVASAARTEAAVSSAAPMDVAPGPKHALQAPATLKPRPRPPPGARPSGKDCRLVSYFDGEGNQHFKEDCSGN